MIQSELPLRDEELVVSEEPLLTVDFAEDGNFDLKSDSLEELVQKLNDQLQDVDQVLKWAYQVFPNGQLIQLTSFGASGMVLLDKLQKLGMLTDVPTVSIDTLHLFEETYQFIDEVKDRYDNMKLLTFCPSGFDSKTAFDEANGADLWRKDPHRYADIAKVEPTLRAMKKLNPSAYLTGRRASQGGDREALQIFEIDNLEGNRLKINPLAHWTFDDVWKYIREHGIMYNPLHDRGYKSIGDTMTTTPVAQDADERSGRFVGLGKTECGIHNRPKHLKKKKKKKNSV